MTQPSRSLVVLMTGALVAVGTPVLAAPPEPSSTKDLADSRHTAREKEQQLEQATARLKKEKAELTKLGERAERAQKRYNEEVATLKRSRKAFDEARQQMRMAGAKYETAQAEAARTAPGRAEAPQPEAVQEENVQADDAQPETVHVETPQAEDAHAEEDGEDGDSEGGEDFEGSETPEGPETSAEPQSVDGAESTERSEVAKALRTVEALKSLKDVRANPADGWKSGAEQNPEDGLGELKETKEKAEQTGNEARQAYDRQKEAVSSARKAKKEADEAYASQKATVSRLLALRKQLLAPADGVVSLAERRRKNADPATEPQAVISKGRKGERAFARGAARGRRVVQAALKWIGTPYSWGGGNASGPSFGIGRGARTRGFDCSGLALYSWAQAGVKLDHFTGSQWNSGPRVPLDMATPGDLVFFARNTKDPDTIHHVGIFIGRGRMVEAPYTGARVRISSIRRKGLIGAVRPA